MQSPSVVALDTLKQIIQQKDKRIKDLELQLKLANLKIQQLESNRRKRFNRFHSTDNESSDDIQVTSKDISFTLKEPLDTAHIAHLNANLNSLKASKPKASEFKLKIPKITEESHKNTAKLKNSDNLHSKKSKTDSNFFIRLDELIFANNFDKTTWNSALTNFRKDPKLLSKVIQTPKEVNRRESMTRASKARKSEGNITNLDDYRPISANIERKWQDVDWSQTILDTYASRGLIEFNFLKDSGLFSPYEVEEFLKMPSITENWEVLYNKGIKTLDKLIQELMLPKGSFVIPIKHSENLGILLKECDKLFRARALVIKILSLVHKREDLLLKIMRYENEDESLVKSYNNFSQISQDILQSIGFLSHFGLHLSEFIYLGGNYSEKVLQDDCNIKELFPSLKDVEDL